MENRESVKLLSLTKQEQLEHHNLETRRYWAEQHMLQDDGAVSDEKNRRKTLPQEWKMTQALVLYDWQEQCVNSWMKAKRGTIKVVTGAGKTILALAIIERLQAENKDLRVAIVVPTIVLQDQWYDEILDNSNLPVSSIGRLGGGHRGQFDKETRILICVLNSAAKSLPDLVAKNKVAGNLLLIADECHKAGASYMQRIFNTQRAYNLGLSATPEREEQYQTSETSPEHYNNTLLGKELGPITFELSVKDALEQGILPEFEIHHYGLQLGPSERDKYENLSRRVRDLTKELRELAHQHGIHHDNIISRTQQLANRKDDLGAAARQHLYLTNQRRHLLYNTKARHNAVVNILGKEFAAEASTRALLFHESIESVMLLYHSLLKEDFPVAVEHSGLPDSVRQASIKHFREGTAQIIVSARSLIEGFNVPETDIGIIVASSTSVRQRIQTIGRLLRKGKDANKVATIYVLYMHKTIDEYIYAKADWDNLLGAQRNRYFLMDEEEKPTEQQNPPRTPLPTENDITLDSLKTGQEYPGVYEGVEYSCDSDGNVFTAEGELVTNPQDIPEKIKSTRGSYGRFKVTPIKSYILVQTVEQEEWVIKYAGRLEERFVAITQAKKENEAQPHNFKDLKLNDVFPAELVSKDAQIIYLRQNRGRTVLAKREGRGWQFARIEQKATEPQKGKDGSQLLKVACKYRKTYHQLSKMLVTDEGHVVVLRGGEYRYITTLTAGLEFP